MAPISTECVQIGNQAGYAWVRRRTVCVPQFTRPFAPWTSDHTMPDSSFPPVVAIFGCTGVGKSGYAIHAARRFDGEIVNADSRYMYRDLTIGVAKPTHEEQESVRHHLLDLYDPHDHLSVSTVQRLAVGAIDDILARGKVPFLVGGTPLYMNAITEGWRVPEVAPDWEYRKQIEARIDEEGLASVLAELQEIDPILAARSGPNPRRVIRALEIHHVTGRPMSELEGKEPPPYRFLNLLLQRDRSELFARLDERVDHHIDEGLVDEVRGLLASGLSGTEPAFSSIGYRQLLPYLAGAESLDAGTDRIKRDTHRYVRHQTTWFRRRSDLISVDTGEAEWVERADSLIQRHISDSGAS